MSPLASWAKARAALVGNRSRTRRRSRPRTASASANARICRSVAATYPAKATANKRQSTPNQIIGPSFSTSRFPSEPFMSHDQTTPRHSDGKPRQQHQHIGCHRRKALCTQLP